MDFIAGELGISRRTRLEQGAVKTVKELAESIGYYDPAYFSKLYCLRFGKTPSEYLSLYH